MRLVILARVLIAVALAGALGLCPFRALADVHALVVGINDYEFQPKLEGAVADAEDIAAALRGINVRSLVVLEDRQATRMRISEVWEAAIRQAKPGDTIILTYAGHGGQEDYTPRGKPTEKAESFLLATFKAKGPTSGERILDKEINIWLKRAGERGLNVIFVADSCHSGGMLRSIDPRATVIYRSVPDYGIPDVLLTSDDLVLGADLTSGDLPHVTFFAATQSSRRSPEVVIDGKRRGALSYAFARALEGAADRKRSGTISKFQLASFITETVRQLSEAQQTPDIVYRSGSEHDPLLTGIPREALPGSEIGPVHLRLVNTDGPAHEGLAKGLTGATIVDGASPADLVWDGNDLTVVSGLGDPVARDVTALRLQGVVDKWRALPALKRLVLAHPLAMSLRPSDARHPAGRQITFESGALPFPYVTVFDIASDGMIQYLYPLPERRGDSEMLAAGAPYHLRLQVVPPFGADHLVVIASAAPLHGLHRLLRSAPRASDLPALLNEALGGTDHVIGLQSLYTEAQ